MLDALADVCSVLVVRQRRTHITHGMEVVSLNVSLVHCLQHGIDVGSVTQRHHLQHVIMMVEHDHHLI